jgi:hypothetical protein
VDYRRIELQYMTLQNSLNFTLITFFDNFCRSIQLMVNTIVSRICLVHILFIILFDTSESHFFYLCTVSPFRLFSNGKWAKRTVLKPKGIVMLDNFHCFSFFRVPVTLLKLICYFRYIA